MLNRTEWYIFLISLIVLAFFTKTGVVSWNDASRLDSIQAVVERQTFMINNTAFGTGDKVIVNGHEYSDKTPLSFLIGVPIYYLLYSSGITFANSSQICYYLITLLTVGILTSAMLVCFFRLLSKYKMTTKDKLFFTTALGIGTLIFPYSTVLNNHTMAAAFLLFSFYFSFFSKNKYNYFLGGLCGGLAASIDVVTGSMILLLMSVLLLLRIKTKIGWFVLGAFIPISTFLVINYFISGSIIPLAMRPEFWNYPGTAFLGSASGVYTRPLNQIAPYIIELLIGKNGFFAYTPLLFFSLISAIFAIHKKHFKPEAIVILLGCVLSILYFSVKTVNDGCAYGFRYTIPLIPLLFFFTPMIFQIKNKYSQQIKILLIIVFVVSIAISLIGVTNPWTCSEQIIPNETTSTIIKQILSSPTVCSLR